MEINIAVRASMFHNWTSYHVMIIIKTKNIYNYNDFIWTE